MEEDIAYGVNTKKKRREDDNKQTSSPNADAENADN